MLAPPLMATETRWRSISVFAATAVPHAETVDVSGTGHMVAGDDNDAFTAAVADFLDRIPHGHHRPTTPQSGHL